MLLLCQGVNGVRKDGEAVVWNHHKQSFHGESLTVNACPQLMKLIQLPHIISASIFNQLLTGKRYVNSQCSFSSMPLIHTEVWLLMCFRLKEHEVKHKTSELKSKKTAFILSQLREMMQQGVHMP